MYHQPVATERSGYWRCQWLFISQIELLCEANTIYLQMLWKYEKVCAICNVWQILIENFSQLNITFKVEMEALEAGILGSNPCPHICNWVPFYYHGKNFSHMTSKMIGEIMSPWNGNVTSPHSF